MRLGWLFRRATLALAGLVGVKEGWEWCIGAPGALDLRSLALIATLLAIAAVTSATPTDATDWPRAIAGRPVLAVDLDEVLGGYLPAFVDFNNATYGTNLSVADFHSYMFWEVPGMNLSSREASIERVYEFHASKYFGRIEALPGAKLALDVLRKHFDLHVVTSRQTDIEPQTREWIEQFFPDTFTALHFGNHFGKPSKNGVVAKVSKPDMCARIRAVALIDDSIDYARQCAAAGIPVFLFGDYPWNRMQPGMASLDARVTRVANWRMVAQLVSPQVIESMARV